MTDWNSNTDLPVISHICCDINVFSTSVVGSHPSSAHSKGCRRRIVHVHRSQTRWNEVIHNQFKKSNRTLDCKGQLSRALTSPKVIFPAAPPKRPGSDYELVPGLGYYKFHVTPLSWEEARLTCHREGAHLAIVNSETENGVLKRLFAKFPSFETEGPLNTQAYLGVNDILVEGHFVTVFEPSSRDRPVLPDGYTTIDQVGSYKWHLEQKGWDEAEATCQSEGGHLVVINSDKEALFVLDLFSSQKGEVQTDLKSSHYGVRDNEQDGSFVTIYGTPLSETGYERWARGQPDDENGVEFCIELLRNGEFNDEPCFKELPFICEILFH
uniref:(California timema) hypothetical protein n=1 Tax=Timema californicum TaxID=61474 RepID=A0A7R9IV45_TIMCA|nr:unnamed protein product [Timema californicum]